MELMGVDLQVDPYFVESEGEDDGLFGDAAVAADSLAAAKAEGVDALDAAEDAESETVEARFLPGPPEATQSQAEDHRASGQIPFRSWCTECVLTRRAGEQHRRRQDKQGT